MSPYYRKLRDVIGNELLLIPSVAAIIHNAEGELLLQRKHDGTWSLPAGAIEPGESPEQAVVREVLEETGMLCTASRIVAVLGGSEFRYTYSNGHAVEYVIMLYHCSAITKSAITDKEETAELRYFRRDDFPGLVLPYDLSLLYAEA
ncbi:MAG: NUDIX domain-containing protein [Candidatus Methylacidiphilales bacterium]|nr:NUDIX domain-containing protein [Candidatus Methylacidiphilales bacterium]